MSLVGSEFDTTSLVLATADAVLNDVAQLTAARGLVCDSSNNIESDGAKAIGDSGVTNHGCDLTWLGTRLSSELRKNALDLEKQLRARGDFVLMPVMSVQGVDRFARALRLDENGDVVSMVGAVVGDPHRPILIDVESPLVVEALARHVDSSLTDRVRVFSQLVGLYCDSIRFFGYQDCPLGDAVRLLRGAVRELRDDQAAHTGDSSENTGDDRHPHDDESTGNKNTPMGQTEQEG